jgi:hypothetical protein
MKFSVKIFSSLFISLLSVTICSNAIAVNTDKPERWFEIEVILFNQLGDKALLKEKFPDNVNSTSLPQYKKHFDLLTPYIQPNLTGIKQFMPLCSEAVEQHDLLNLLPEINLPSSDNMSTFEQLNIFSMPEFETEASTKYKTALPHRDKKRREINHNSFLLAQQKKRVTNEQKKLASELFSTQEICVISRQDIENLFTAEQLANMPLDAFYVEALPTKLNTSGAHISNSPYLIANESLLLSEIKQSLQWSKEFKPLLHFGWRQVGVTRDKAIPLKLFAGKHLNGQYQQALKSYQSALVQHKHEEQTEQFSLKLLNNAEHQEIGVEITTLEQNQIEYAEIKQQKLTEIFNTIDSIDSVNINNFLGEFEQKTIEDLLTLNEVTQEESERLTINKEPIEPLQPWFLDGFFKVHLDHYLYITADFNVISQSSNKNLAINSTNNTKVKLINFSQNKRAITGEIHYFDHPFIGMIVQIRRFDPSKPKEEAVTQVIN